MSAMHRLWDQPHRGARHSIVHTQAARQRVRAADELRSRSLTKQVSVRPLHPDRRPRPDVGWVVSELSATAVLAGAAEPFWGLLERGPGVPTERARDCLKEAHAGIVCSFGPDPQGTFLPTSSSRLMRANSDCSSDGNRLAAKRDGHR